MSTNRARRWAVMGAPLTRWRQQRTPAALTEPPVSLADGAAPAASEEPSDPSWTRAVVVGLVVYLFSRLAVVAGTAVRAAQLSVDANTDGEEVPGAASVISSVLTSWDGRWYLEIVRLGYPDAIPADITYDQLEARAAFFPLYPWTVRVVDTVLPGGDTFAALLTNFVLGAISVVLVGILARRLYTVGIAARAMTLYAVFPGSAILSFAYAEALVIVLAAACLILLLDERWLLAGLAAALATAARPNGVALVAACLVASALAIRRSRQWSSLIAVALAPTGFVWFQWYVDRRSGETGAWFRVQREAWSEGTSFGGTAITNTVGFLSSPLSSPTNALTALTMIALVAMAWCAWSSRLHWIPSAYCAVVIALMLIPETVTARPRFLFTAFPLFIAVAAWWPERSERAEHRASWEYLGWDVLLVACGAGLAALTGLYAVFGVIP